MKGRLPAPPLPGVAGLQAGLILSVFAYQSLQVSDSFGRFIGTPAWLLPHVLLPGLAALAGQHAMRRLGQHGVRRLLRWLAARLGPALLVAVVIPALAIGPLVSLRPLRAYLVDPELRAYFLNLLFWPQFTLPGVFTFNNVPDIVNDIFRVLPAVPLVILGLCTTAMRPGHAAAILSLLLAMAGGAALALELSGITAMAIGKPLGVIAGFLLGALGAVWRRPLLPRPAAIGIASGLLIAVAAFGQRAWGASAAFNALIALPAGLLIISLSAIPLPRPRFGQRYLVGLLLLGFPVQQASIALGSVQQGFLTNLLISLPVTLALAASSWHLLEARLAGRADTGVPAESEDARRFAGADQPLSMARARRQLIARLPTIGLWLLFITFALAVLAMVIFASQPDRGGI